MTEPKLFFDSEKEMFDCLDYWQKRLGLSDWFIAARICGKKDMTIEDAAGESEVQHVNMCGTISLLRKEDMPDDLLLKQAHEQVLIHELLHFKFIAFDVTDRDRAVYEENQHQLIELLAKALFMARYDLSPNWFIAEKHKYQEDKERVLSRLGLTLNCVKE